MEEKKAPTLASARTVSERPPSRTLVSGPRIEADSTDRIGRLVANRYKLVRVLGEGGMGMVFEAEHVDLGKRVAVKVLSTMFDGHPEATARFLREAKAACRIDSEHIVQVYDVGQDAGVGLYMMMELLKGEDLAHAIAGRVQFEVEAAITMAAQVCLALERAHGAGVVHRDLKPANVFLTRVDDGSIKVKVLDFGIAKLVRDARAAQPEGDITQSGLAVGTPQYMSPEQALALDTVDHRTDVYALGALIFEAITGRAPYPGLESQQLTMLKIISEPAPRLASLVPHVPPALDELVAEMMARNPSDRPQSASDVRARLAVISPTLTKRVSVFGPPPGQGARPETGEKLGPPPRTVSAVAVDSLPVTTRTRPSSRAKWVRPAATLGAFALVATVAFALVSSRGAATAVSVNAGAPATPVAPPALELTVDPTELVHAAERALARGDAVRARELATVATRRTPDRASAWLALGAAEKARGDVAAAHQAYESCVNSAHDDRAADCAALATR